MARFGIKFALIGKMEEMNRKELAKAKKAVTRGMSRVADGAKLQMRRDAIAAGWSTRAANTFRSDSYPKGQASLSAASVIFSKAPHLAEAFNDGVTVKAKGGHWLAIPTENAPKKVGGKKITPSNFPESTYGKLQFIPTKRGDLALLVVDKLRKRRGKRGGYGRASAAALKRGDYENKVPMFIMKRQVKLRRELKSELIADKWESRLPALIELEFSKLDALDGV